MTPQEYAYKLGIYSVPYHLPDDEWIHWLFTNEVFMIEKEEERNYVYIF